MIYNIINLLKKLSDNELDDLYLYIKRQYAVDDKKDDVHISSMLDDEICDDINC